MSAIASGGNAGEKWLIRLQMGKLHMETVYQFETDEQSQTKAIRQALQYMCEQHGMTIPEPRAKR